MANQTAVNTGEYAGPGSFAAAQGQSYVDGLKGTFYGAGAGLAAGGAVAMVAPVKAVELAQKTPIFGRLIKGKAGAVALATLAGSVVLSGVMSITGYFSGSKKADAARAQFEALKAERDIAKSEVMNLQAQVQGLTAEVSEHRKNFTSMHASRAGHGSHVAAHAAEQEAAQHAELAR